MPRLLTKDCRQQIRSVHWTVDSPREFVHLPWSRALNQFPNRELHTISCLPCPSSCSPSIFRSIFMRHAKNAYAQRLVTMCVCVCVCRGRRVSRVNWCGRSTVVRQWLCRCSWHSTQCWALSTITNQLSINTSNVKASSLTSRPAIAPSPSRLTKPLAGSSNSPLDYAQNCHDSPKACAT